MLTLLEALWALFDAGSVLRKIWPKEEDEKEIEKEKEEMKVVEGKLETKPE